MEPTISETKYKMDLELDGLGQNKLQVKLSKVDEGTTCIEFMFIAGDRKIFQDFYKTAKHNLKNLLWIISDQNKDLNCLGKQNYNL